MPTLHFPFHSVLPQSHQVNQVRIDAAPVVPHSHWGCQPQGFRNWTSRCPSICVPKHWSTEWKISNKLAASIAWSNKCMIKCNPKSFSFQRYAVRGICSSKQWTCRVFTQDIKTRDCLFNSQKRIRVAFPYFNKSTVSKPTKMMRSWLKGVTCIQLFPGWLTNVICFMCRTLPWVWLLSSHFCSPRLTIPMSPQTGSSYGTKNATTNHNGFGHAQHISELKQE